MTAQHGPELAVPRYRRDPAGTQPPLDSPEYRSTRLRHPIHPPVAIPQTLTEVTGPVRGRDRVGEHGNDLTAQHDAEPIGQRIIMHGRLLDGAGRAVPHSLVEIWQANAGGRYRHADDRWPAPLDANFDGIGRTVTDEDGRYEFTTIKPSAYPWKNHHNAWRPAHIHFSLLGRAFTQRLVTQMYFPDDPLFEHDPIFNSVPEPVRPRLISRFDMNRTTDHGALGFEFNIVLRGRESTPFEEGGDHDH